MRVLVCIPTYAERENLPLVLARLRAAAPDVDVLVVDDASPDGTGELADDLAADDPAVSVLHRDSKSGLGGAYRAGFAWGTERDYDVLVEMDADGSHRPEDLPALLAALEAGADVALGSRYVRGGSVVNWPAHRLLLSRGGNTYTRLVLGVHVQDATGGYRAYRRTALEKMRAQESSSQGYSFQVELLWRAVQAGLTVVEVPITFVERELGESKMSGSIVREALLQVSRWGWESRRGWGQRGR